MTRIGKTKPEESIVCRIFLRALLAGLVVTSGCVPMMVYTFYEPSAETGIVERHACYGNAGPRDTIRFQWEGLELRLSSQKEEDEDLVITAILYPSSETVLRFLSQDFNIKKEDESSKIRPSEVSGVDIYRGVKPYGESVLLTQWATLQGSRHSHYEMYFSFPIGDATHFELQFPPMELNQQKLLLPPITFSQKTEAFFIEPINC